MKTTFASILATTLALAATGALSSPASVEDGQHVPAPAPGTQPGCGPQGCHNPTGTFGLVRNGHAYHLLCDKNSHSALHDHRVRACFDTKLPLEYHLSAPNPEKLEGYIDASGTNMVLFANQIVTIAEALEIHVNEAKHKKDREMGCAEVKVYKLPEWKIQVRETWCPGLFQPVIL